MIQRMALVAELTDIAARAQDGRPARFIASTHTPARSDESVIDQSTWRLDAYRSNPVVLQDHRYSVASIVGRGEPLVEGGRLLLDVTWAPSEAGRMARELYEGGFLHAVSVGWRPGRVSMRSQAPKGSPLHGERGVVYHDNELLEVSMVAIGDDPAALAVTQPGARSASGPLDAEAIAEALAADPTFLRAIAAQLQLSGVPLTPEPAPARADGGSSFSYFRKG